VYFFRLFSFCIPLDSPASIQWAVETFNKWFKTELNNVERHSRQGDFFLKVKYDSLCEWLMQRREEPDAYEKAAIYLFEEYFVGHLSKLIVDAEGELRSDSNPSAVRVDGNMASSSDMPRQVAPVSPWSALKRCPRVEPYDSSNPDHAAFVNLTCELLRSVRSFADGLVFDKDNRTHLSFLLLGAKIRSAVFGVPFLADMSRVRRVSGMAPALMTTTCVSAALACLQVYATSLVRLRQQQQQQQQQQMNESSEKENGSLIQKSPPSATISGEDAAFFPPQPATHRDDLTLIPFASHLRQHIFNLYNCYFGAIELSGPMHARSLVRYLPPITDCEMSVDGLKDMLIAEYPSDFDKNLYCEFYLVSEKYERLPLKSLLKVCS
jgi:hypothetical protein